MHIILPVARNAVVKYAIFGLKRAKQLMANKEGTKEIFDYIQKVCQGQNDCERKIAMDMMILTACGRL